MCSRKQISHFAKMILASIVISCNTGDAPQPKQVNCQLKSYQITYNNPLRPDVTVNYTYNDLGQVTEVSDWTSSARYTYDPLGRIIAATGQTSRQTVTYEKTRVDVKHSFAIDNKWYEGPIKVYYRLNADGSVQSLVRLSSSFKDSTTFSLDKEGNVSKINNYRNRALFSSWDYVASEHRNPVYNLPLADASGDIFNPTLRNPNVTASSKKGGGSISYKYEYTMDKNKYPSSAKVTEDVDGRVSTYTITYTYQSCR